jgi:hypothetical protein
MTVTKRGSLVEGKSNFFGILDPSEKSKLIILICNWKLK